MERTRSAYRAVLDRRPLAPAAGARVVDDRDRADLAHLLLAAYRGTVDDEVSRSTMRTTRSTTTSGASCVGTPSWLRATSG